jgi:hypothetical protein
MRFPEKEFKRFLPGVAIAIVVIATVTSLIIISQDRNDDPEAVIIIQPQVVHANTPVVLDGRNSTDSNGDLGGLTFEWKIMDRFESGHSWLEFSFPRQGNFTVTLKVIEGSGRSDTETIFVEVLSE